jgi:cytochrome c oxidase subunit 3
MTWEWLPPRLAISPPTTGTPLSPPALARERSFPPAAVLGTLFLIAGDVMLFAGLIFAFWVLRLAAPAWPPPLQPRLPLAVTALNTLVLLASSAAVVAALRARRRRDDRALVRWLGTGALLGGLFLVIQGYEWIRLVGFGLTVGSGIFGALFYTLIGTHGLHVLAGLAWLATTLGLACRGRFVHGEAAPLHACATYWHFVVALWPVLYLCVYLL